MKTRTKVIFSALLVALLSLIVVLSVALIFAATNQTITSNISVTYTSKEVIGSATARWGEYMNCSWYDMEDNDGNTEIKFDLDELTDASLSPNRELTIEKLNDYIVFEYNFTNDGTKPYELTLTYQDDDVEDKNVKLYTMATPIGDSYGYWLGTFDAEFSSGIDYIKEFYIRDNFTGTLKTTVLPNITIQIFILLEVENWGADASFSGSMNFDLDGTKTEEYTDDFLYYINDEFATLIGVAKGEPHAEYPDVKLSPNNTLSVPATYNGLPVKTIGPAAFWQQTNLTTISSFGNVETILSEAFCNTSLSGNLTIPGTVKYIAYGFNTCEIINLTIQNGIVYIGNGSFGSCNKLSRVTVPSSVEQIGYAAFDSDSNLTDVTIDSQTVCQNLIEWEKHNDWPNATKTCLIDYATTIKAKYEIVGIESYSRKFTKSPSKDGDDYWVYTYNG